MRKNVGESRISVMNISLKTQRTIAFLLALVLLGIIVVTNLRNNSEKDTSTTNTNQTETSTTSDETKNDAKPSATTSSPEEIGEQEDVATEPVKTEPAPTPSYTYKAVSGDSYTGLAREAIREYSQLNNIESNVRTVQKAAGELALEAGMPYLEIGQTVQIDVAAIEKVLGVSKQETSTEQKTTESNESSEEATETSDSANDEATVTVVAVAGDSYSRIVRKAITEYSAKNNIVLTGAQRIAAETRIITEAGFPALEIDERIEISTNTITTNVAYVQTLSNEQLLLWQPYAKKAGL